MCFCSLFVLLGFGCVVREVEDCARIGAADDIVAGSLIPRDSDAGGPTGTMREPNSTPIVTSCCEVC